MIFTPLRDSARVRFNDVMIYINYVESLEPTVNGAHNNIIQETPPQVKMFRGLFYVHIYSYVEKTVNDLLIRTIASIKEKNICNKHFITQFNSISLHSKMQSFKQSKNTLYLSKACDVFSGVEGESVCTVAETVFSEFLQNIWYKTIAEVLAAFGITNFTRTPIEIATIDEVVNKRNAVAHGRLSAVEVGEAHNCSVLRDKMNIIDNLVNELIDTFELYVINLQCVKTEFRVLYI
ncbi:MAE_28990/MAE_18760 family HEPN-like nuclease [Yersinia enterocolitica]|uniref:MAE_28990/MAE_18760 family HEPN-like nuclease n=1 Tax=Yersinia enterocolitica TaxID=630 RepID=UPI0005DAAE66|nr:MAE_28990/MAE_18760 family HEPN-like nuclease [Yersinia enterocolitica]MDN0099161.1 MAE_28990/MAE_18760 family HEPN-like nuclease [Yersinia enterocolitica]CQJ36195.1 Uncharacterised protein [Yersinia enterocolitica]